jgi:hypothetical protein
MPGPTSFKEGPSSLFGRPLRLALGRSSLGLCCLGVGFFGVGCASGPQAVEKRPQTPRPTQPLTVVTQTHESDTAKYLASVYRQLSSGWENGVKKLASTLLSIKHPLNDIRLAAAVQVRLGGGGNPYHMKLTRASGNHRFDNTAMRLLARVRWPKPPARFAQRKLVLVWHFFRDQRGCDYRFTRVRIGAFDHERAFRQAILRNDIKMASSIIERAGPDSKLLSWLTRQGLKTAAYRPRVLAVQISPTAVLTELLAKIELPRSLWQTALTRAHELRRADVIATAARQLASTLEGWKPLPPFEDKERARRLALLFDGMDRYRVRPSARNVRYALGSGQPRLVSAALRYETAPTRVRRAIYKAKMQNTKDGVAIMVRLAHDNRGRPNVLWAIKHLRHVLRSGTTDLQQVVLARLIRFPVRQLRATLTKLYIEHPKPALRVPLVKAYASVGGPLGPLYRGLNRADGQEKLLLIEAIGRARLKSRRALAASYRLGSIAYKDPPPYRGIAIVALARIAHPKFAKDLQYLISRLRLKERLAILPLLLAIKPLPKTALKQLARGRSNDALKQRVREALDPQPKNKTLLTAKPPTKSWDPTRLQRVKQLLSLLGAANQAS